MKKIVLMSALALSVALGTSSAYADSRLVDGVLGAGAGALVGGPVGLVAGGVIGYTSGPRISCSMRNECRHRHHRRRDYRN